MRSVCCQVIHGGRNLVEVVSDLEAKAVAHQAEAVARAAGEAAAKQQIAALRDRNQELSNHYSTVQVRGCLFRVSES